jgi:two-component system alkaline phosphatase synthesis response regulator PhoP
MPAKKLKSSKPPIRRTLPPPIAEGEIDVLRFMVRSTLGRDAQKRKTFTEVSFGDVRIDFVRHELFRNGKQLEANAREFQLLKYFLQHEGEVVSRDQLLTDVWGFEKTPNTRSVDNYILSLRKKIEDDAAHPRHILTFRGAGYKFVR